MSIFCFKKLSKTVRLGQKLRERREAAGLDLASVSALTHISEKYLKAIEAGAYKDLPRSKAYRTAYIKEYAKAIGWDPSECVAAFGRESGFAGTNQPHPKTGVHLFPFASVSIAVRNLLLAGAAVLFAVYLGWQVRGILEPPRLEIFSPPEGAIVSQLSAIVEGATDPETSLTINGQNIVVNEKGDFSTKLDLTDGLNTITVQAIKKHGKTTTLTRHIVVKQNPIGQVSVN